MLQIKRGELKQLAQNKLGDDSIESQNKVLVMISTSLAARTSYTVVGDEKVVDYEKMIALHDRLLAQYPPHSSPFEHCCQCLTEEEYNSSFKTVGFKYGKAITEKGWVNNYHGFKSYRSIIENS